jgi:hypothetical protein
VPGFLWLLYLDSYIQHQARGSLFVTTTLPVLSERTAGRCVNTVIRRHILDWIPGINARMQMPASQCEYGRHSEDDSILSCTGRSLFEDAMPTTLLGAFADIDPKTTLAHVEKTILLLRHT